MGWLSWRCRFGTFGRLLWWLLAERASLIIWSVCARHFGGQVWPLDGPGGCWRGVSAKLRYINKKNLNGLYQKRQPGAREPGTVRDSLAPLRPPPRHGTVDPCDRAKKHPSQIDAGSR